MAKKLTDIGIRNLKPAATRREISDGGTGLYLVLQPNGKRSWAVRYRFHGAPRKLTLGSMPPVMLAEARKLASEALYGLGQDIDPAAIKQQSKLATAERAQDTVERLIEVYLGQYAKRARPATWAQASGIFRRDVLPRWGGRLVTEITRKDVRELIRAIAIDRPIMANRAQAYLSRFFRWLMNEDYITGSPAVGIEHPAKENARDRALSDPEIRKFWAATHALPKPFGDIYKVLLLSGARRQEVAEMEWRELDLAQKTWKLPAQRSKSRISHILPLGPMAWDIIAAQPRSGDHVFGRARRGFSHQKVRLDAAMQTNEPWRSHDLRRTARSLMARARIDSEVAERMIGHLPRGLIRTYNVFDYIDAKRDGFTRLEREIDLIVNPPAADVIAFRR
jgi:integrase